MHVPIYQNSISSVFLSQVRYLKHTGEIGNPPKLPVKSYFTPTFNLPALVHFLPPLFLAYLEAYPELLRVSIVNIINIWFPQLELPP